ncbi:GlxA family transcriptional regulator [Virgisporangium aurantiacum]|uniref:GlxA family transcriptional regulator n=1 Tax=Virgisporangium aurantiacum TaxID=175570 RepID=UPI001EF2CD38|nr:helix-turn-helix domain-containing protein [Virgisporangium aurantiacum]
MPEVFGGGAARGLPAFGIRYCTDRPGRLTTDLGLSFVVGNGPDRLAGADLLVVLPSAEPPEPSAELTAAIRGAHRRGAILASHGVGTYTLAATGLLDGRRATTHWLRVDDLAARHPAVEVVPQVLYVDEGRIVTGAGAGAGIDLYLHLVRREHGSTVANTIARYIVVPPYREGGRAQFAPAPSDSEGERLTGVMDWAAANLDRPLPVTEMARRALMSTRTFVRRFKAITGTTPHAWLLHQRLIRTEELLESTELPMEEVARRVGYASATVLRERFVKHRGVPLRAYRQAFDATATRRTAEPPDVRRYGSSDR